MTNKFTEQFTENINFIYNSFDRVILRGYITSLFVEGSVINLLRNLGFNNHSNGHNYLKQQFDNLGKSYTMEDNSFTKVKDIETLNSLVSEFQPSDALNRIDYWMNLFFHFDKGIKSTRSKLLSHNWYTEQTKISTNIIFKSPKFTSSLFQRILNKHHTIGLPDKLTEIFSLRKNPNNSIKC